ncbi:hypothetical protein COL05_11855 [Bacillus sp. AFS059628]|uniref:hypothetical protein n=1 Tax=Bacillus sp. AFS059628 TaxID=2033508 RepID=UPI000BF800A9|nr:hypothetical protein [Bacillus sp. AFS059628]PFV82189.1 hypothetical protein COL05_11855 [Bacillus sp. AFS059628]
MLKKIVIGALTTGVLLTGGISANASELSIKEKNKEAYAQSCRTVYYNERYGENDYIPNYITRTIEGQSIEFKMISMTKKDGENFWRVQYKGTLCE